MLLRRERNELDKQLANEAAHFFEEWRGHGGERFDWAQDAGRVKDWIAASTPPRLVEVVDASGRLLFRSASLKPGLLAGLTPGFRTVEDGHSAWRVGVFVDGPITLHLGGDLTDVNDLAEELAATFLVALPFVLTVVVVGGRFIAYKALSPIQEIISFAERVTAQGLSNRLPLPPAQDELHRLTIVLNETFDRLEQAFLQATRFSADASHELKTPLTILRSSIEAMMQMPNLDPEITQNLGGLLEETKRLSSITESLLLLARADAGKLQLDLQPGDIVEVVRLCAEDAAIQFEAENIHLEVQAPESAPALLDRTRLSQILTNLFDNARKYNLRNGSVRASVVEVGEYLEVKVSNTGLGIAPNEVPLLFTRFYRAEPNPSASGQGLGLSLSRELARAHRGDLVFAGSVAGWTTFVLRLPKLSERKGGVLHQSTAMASGN